MNKNAPDTIEQAQAFVGGDIEFERLDQIYDLQRLLGPVIAYKVLLSIAINSADPKEQRLAASQLLTSAGEDPGRIADRLRASLFKDTTLEQLEAVVKTGITDPALALQKMRQLKAVEEVPVLELTTKEQNGSFTR